MSLAPKQPLVIRRSVNTEVKPSEESVPALSREEVTSMVREHLECLLKLICPSPSDISVTAVHGERTTIFKIDCSQKNIGRVLGKGGQNINGLRKFVLAITSNHGFRSIVEVPYHPIDV